jgi:dihydrofolate reductase
MNISIIAAVGKNFEIGKNNDLIWHLPKDMAFFTESTTGHHVIMGRRNYDSIPLKYRPLKNRPNVIVTRQAGFEAADCVVVNTIEEGIEWARRHGETECFIIGGGQIYKETLEKGLADRMYLTHIHEAFDADTFFPTFDASQWTKAILLTHQKDEKNKYDFDVVRYDRMTY